MRAELDAIAEVVTPGEVHAFAGILTTIRFLRIAVRGAADALVTGDADPLAVGMHGGVSIISVAGFEAMGTG